MRQALLDQVQRELERLIPDITQTSRDSLLGAIGSQLQLSLHSVLAP